MDDIDCCYPECTFNFQNVDELEWHLAEDHHKCYSYQCEQCYLSKRPSLFPTQAGVRDHLIHDHGLQDHYFRHLFSTEIDMKREKIRQDLDRCLKPSEQKLSSPHNIETRILCEREVQTEQVHQDKEQIKHIVQLKEKVPDLLREIAAIKVESEDVEIISSKIAGKSPYNGSVVQQLQPTKRQLDEELCKDMSVFRSQSTGSSNSVPSCADQTDNLRPSGPVTKKLKRVEEIVDKSRAADPRLRSQYLQSIIPDMLAMSEPAATADINSPKKDLPFPATSITIKLNNESRVSSEEDINELDDSWMHSSHSSRELSKEAEVQIDTVDCAICGIEVENKPVNNLLHINSCHLRYELYTCRQCKRPFYGAWEEALDHLNHDHPTTLASLDSHHSVLLKDYSTTYFPKIAKTMKRYFPGQGVKFENWKSLQGQHPSKKK